MRGLRSARAGSVVAVALAMATLAGCGLTPPSVFSTNRYGDNAYGARTAYKAVEAEPSLQTAQSSPQALSFRDGARVLTTLPYVYQNPRDNTCAQAASTMLLNYWGVRLPYQQVVNESNRFNLATSASTVQGYLKSKGLHVQAYRKANLDFLKSLVEQARPPMVLLDFEGAEHWVLVVGYNDATERMVLHDSINGAYFLMRYEKFERRWRNEMVKRLPLVGGENYDRIALDVSR